MHSWERSVDTIPRGSLWHRWDLHVHTPSSFDYEDKSLTDEQIVDSLVQAGLRVVAITDHHTIDVIRIAKLKKLGEGRLTILPGIELRGDHGGDPIHYICIFPETCNLDHVWPMLQGRLGLTSESVAQKGGDQQVYVPIEEGAKVTRELGGIVSIHAGAKRNIIEADLVDCIVTLPGKLFFSTPVPVCLWFPTRSKTGPAFRDRRRETSVIDASSLGHAESRANS
jgi:hypothetical protein